VSDELAFLLNHDGEVLDKLVVNAFLNTDLGANLVLEGTRGERKGGEALVTLSEEGAGLLHLEAVEVLELALEHGGAHVAELTLTFTGRNVHVEVDNLTLVESPLFNLLGGLLLRDDGLVAVDAVLLDFVGESTLHHVALVGSSDLVHVLGDLVVGRALFDLAFSSTENIVSSFDRVSSTRGSLAITNNNGVGSGGTEAINLGTNADLGNITSSKLGGLVLERGVVTNNVVDRDASGESNTTIDLLCLLTVVNFLELLLNVCIDSLAHLVKVSTNLAESDSMFHGSIGNEGSCFVLIKLGGVLDEVLVVNFLFLHLGVFSLVNH